MQHLDHLRAGGGITASAPVYDLKAGRRRIAETLAARATERTAARSGECGRCGCQLPDSGNTEQPANVSPAAFTDSQALQSGPAPAGAEGLSLQDHADRDLRTLAMMIINEEGAAAALHQLVRDGRTEPRGGLVFGSLLFLAGRFQEAQFWWQFAGGADIAIACFLLYLHHVRLGELRAAEHWFLQAARLEGSSVHQDSPPPALPPVPEYYLDCLLAFIGQYLQADTADLQWPDQALLKALDDVDTVRDSEYGPVSLPTEDLAEQLHELVTTTS